MGFIERTLDLKKCARALRRHPGSPEHNLNFDVLTPRELNPCLQSVYIEILRRDTITIANLDFGEIGEGDIDDLERVLYNSPANELFEVSDVFRQFEPFCTIKMVFI